MYVRLRRSCAVFNTGEEARCSLSDRIGIILLLLGLGDRECDLKLLPPDSTDPRPLLTTKKFLSQYFSRSGYSPADDNPSSD